MPPQSLRALRWVTLELQKKHKIPLVATHHPGSCQGSKTHHGKRPCNSDMMLGNSDPRWTVTHHLWGSLTGPQKCPGPQGQKTSQIWLRWRSWGGKTILDHAGGLNLTIVPRLGKGRTVNLKMAAPEEWEALRVLRWRGHVQGNARALWELRDAPSQQPGRKERPPSYNCREINPANTWLGKKRYSSQKRKSAADTWVLATWDPGHTPDQQD